MPEFVYTALDPSGKRRKGSFTGTSENELRAFLSSRDMTPVSFSVVREEEKALPRFLRRKTYRLKDMVFFTRQFATLLGAGLNVSSSLATLRKQPVSRSSREALESMYSDSLHGVSLAESLGKNQDAFPDFLIRMMEIGEISGNLDALMVLMADYYEREYDLRKKIRNALTYPILILVASVLVLIFILTFILPSFVSMFQANDARLPFLTVALITLSDGIRTYWPLLLAGLAGTIFFLRSFLNTPRGQDFWSGLKLNIPVVRGKYLMILTSRFARTMQILLYSGVTITRSLEITSGVMDNTVVRTKVLRIRDLVNQGEPFHLSLNSIRFFPAILVSMAEIGETSGSLDAMLSKASAYYDREMERAMEQLVKLIEPAAIILIAAVVGTSVLAILLPMLDLINMV